MAPACTAASGLPVRCLAAAAADDACSINHCDSCHCHCACFLQHLLATFRSSRVNSMAFELNSEQASLTVTLKCDNGALPMRQRYVSCKLHLLGRTIYAAHLCLQLSHIILQTVQLRCTAELVAQQLRCVVPARVYAAACCRSAEALRPGHLLQRHPAGHPGR
eukprot:GHRQ01017741.1.p1 GENE.GHRQ01017741.1~~GHRQ01017741.1.p1  ORF type:complete len:163 (+),score=19.28 GHRQ01017741.1:1233-1721(+)